MIDQIIESALAHWQELSPDKPRPQDLRFVLQSRRRIVLFLFDTRKRGQKLVGVVKISRRAEANNQLEQTVRVLGEVRRQLDGWVQDTVPRAILLEPVHGLGASLQQALPGTPMYLSRTRWLAVARHRRNWEAWGRWLREFQRQCTGKTCVIDARSIDRLIVPHLLEALSQAAGGRQLVAELRAVVSDLEGVRATNVWRFGDAQHSNILLASGSVSGVVDWEGAEADQWPTSDWYQFAFQYVIDVYRTQYPEATEAELGQKAVRALFQPADSSLTEMVQEQTRKFLASWGLNDGLGPPFLVAFLAQCYWPWDKASLLRHAHSMVRS
jgi:hypothetical protein